MLSIVGLVVLLVLLVTALALYTTGTGGFGFAPRGEVERAGAPDEVVVVTFNIRNGRAWDGWDSWPFRSRSAARQARALGADVLAVQESFWFQNRFLRTSLPGYRLVGRGRGARGGEWCGVYLRSDRLSVVQAETRWFGDHPRSPGSRLPDASFPRIATLVRPALVGRGQEIEVANAHLDERSPENRLRSVVQLVSWMDPDVPRVVVGDLNATWSREPELFATLTAAGLTDALPAEAGGTTHDFRGRSSTRRIDHIFVSDHWEVIEARVLTDDRTRGLPSDHWPVLARIRLKDDETGPS